MNKKLRHMVISALAGFGIGVAVAQFFLPAHGLLLRAAVVVACVGGAIGLLMALARLCGPPQTPDIH